MTYGAKLTSIGSLISSVIDGKPSNIVNEILVTTTGETEKIGSVTMTLDGSSPPRKATWSFLWIKTAGLVIVQVPDFAVGGSVATWTATGSTFSRELSGTPQRLPTDSRTTLKFENYPSSLLSEGVMTVTFAGNLTVKAQRFVFTLSKK